MKHYKISKYLFIASIFTIIGCTKDKEEEPIQLVADAALNEYIINNYDTDNDGKISIKELDAIRKIDLSEENIKISSLVGLDTCRNLKTLIIDNQDFTELNVSNLKSLRNLSIQNNPKFETLIVKNRSFFEQIFKIDYNKSFKVVDTENSPLRFYGWFKNIRFKMLFVPKGSFQMCGEYSYLMEAKNKHQVTLTKDYFLGETEVTQELYEAVMGENPSEPIMENGPVNKVTWTKAKEFTEKLSEELGYNFRLPTEAEWEYAGCYGKDGPDDYTYYAGSVNLDVVAWCVANSEESIHEVGKLRSTFLGFYDMSGNVAEWCSDFYQEEIPAEDVVDPQGPKRDGRIDEYEALIEKFKDKPKLVETYRKKIEKVKANPWRCHRGGSFMSAEDYYCSVKYRSLNSEQTEFKSIGLRLALSF